MPPPPRRQPRLDLALHPKQWAAISSPATEILLGGAAGGGKSYCLRAAAIIYALEVPGLQAYLFRRHYSELIKNHMEGPSSFPNLLAPLVKAKLCRITRNEIRLYNGSAIFLANVERDAEVQRYRGYEFHLLCFDELTTFSEYQYRFLRGRCRMAGIQLPGKYASREQGGVNERPLFPRILCGSNPGGIGHGFVKRAFISSQEPLQISKASQAEGGMYRQFIPSKLEDNPALDAEQYAGQLRGMGDPLLVRAMLDGDWSVVSGSMYGDTWRHAEHTCRPFPIPVDWQIWRGADDGYAAPAACCWLTQDPSTKRYYVIDELHKTQMLPAEFAQRVLARDASIPVIDHNGNVTINKTKLSGLLDSAAFGDTGQGAIVRGKQMNALGCNWRPVEKWPGSRAHRAQNLHRLLAPLPDGKPGLRIFTHCLNLIETIPTLSRDPRSPELVNSDDEGSHMFDAVTYALQWRDNTIQRIKLGGF